MNKKYTSREILRATWKPQMFIFSHLFLFACVGTFLTLKQMNVFMINAMFIFIILVLNTASRTQYLYILDLIFKKIAYTDGTEVAMPRYDQSTRPGHEKNLAFICRYRSHQSLRIQRIILPINAYGYQEIYRKANLERERIEGKCRKKNVRIETELSSKFAVLKFSRLVVEILDAECIIKNENCPKVTRNSSNHFETSEEYFHYIEECIDKGYFPRKKPTSQLTI